MKISEIARRQPTETRHVGLHTDHIHVTELAIRVYELAGIDVTIEHDHFFIDVPRALAASTQGAIERATGHIAYNEWDEPIRRRTTYGANQ